MAVVLEVKEVAPRGRQWHHQLRCDEIGWGKPVVE